MSNLLTNVAQLTAMDSSHLDNELGTWPWLSLISDEENFDPNRQCSGVLICQNWLLTTDKCAQGEKLTVELGVHDKIKSVKSLTILDKHFNTNYGLALLQFRSTETKDIFSWLIQPICLIDVDEDELDNRWIKEEYMYVAGWASEVNKIDGSQQPIYTKLDVVNSVDCRDSFKETITNVTEGSFCAGNKYGGNEACKTLRGAPIMRVKNGRVDLMGLASRTEMCDQPGHYALFTGVLQRQVINWIHEETGRCNAKIGRPPKPSA